MQRVDLIKIDKNANIGRSEYEVISYLKDNEKNLEDGTHLLFVTKNIERIGDHTTNVAEQVYFLVTGEYLEGDRPKGTEPIVTGEK